MKIPDKDGYIDRLLLLKCFDDARLPITKSERRIINALPTVEDDPYTTTSMYIKLQEIVNEIRKSN